MIRQLQLYRSLGRMTWRRARHSRRRSASPIFNIYLSALAFLRSQLGGWRVSQPLGFDAAEDPESDIRALHAAALVPPFVHVNWRLLLAPTI
jgi:hypothetical protein